MILGVWKNFCDSLINFCKPGNAPLDSLYTTVVNFIGKLEEILVRARESPYIFRQKYM